MNRRAFTLIELLVVMGIMGFLGTVSVGGYRAMQRGMEERGVMQNVNQFIRTAYQRAQIDRQPTAVYFWNETLREESEDQSIIVVGRAVAVRRAGRFSLATSSMLVDEYGDLERSYPVAGGNGNGSSRSSGSKDDGFYVYRMASSQSSQFQRSIVSQKVEPFPLTEVYLLGQPMDGVGSGELTPYAFKVLDLGGVTWKTGDAYGFEFAELELPHNYVFGSSYSTSIANPVREVSILTFGVSGNSGSGSKAGIQGASSIQVSSLRPDKSGALSAQKVDMSDSPTKEL